jgi:hypothetical protein
MPLRLLIIREIKTVTRLIHYIRAEYSDAVVDWFSSALDASMILQNNKYDSVLCGLKMAHMNGIAFKKNWIHRSINRRLSSFGRRPTVRISGRNWQDTASHPSAFLHIAAAPKHDRQGHRPQEQADPYALQHPGHQGRHPVRGPGYPGGSHQHQHRRHSLRTQLSPSIPRFDDGRQDVHPSAHRIQHFGPAGCL